MNVNYENLNGGIPTQALRELTNMPVKAYIPSSLSDQELFDIISDGSAKEYTMVSACSKDLHGLVKGRAYTVLDAIELFEDGKPY